MLSCEDVSRIISRSQDEQLPWSDRLRVKTHLLMCKACQRMVRQMECLRDVARRYESTSEEPGHPEAERLSQEARTRILTRLRQTEDDS